jgi:hypothetical protein
MRGTRKSSSNLTFISTMVVWRHCMVFDCKTKAQRNRTMARSRKLSGASQASSAAKLPVRSAGLQRLQDLRLEIATPQGRELVLKTGALR